MEAIEFRFAFYAQDFERSVAFYRDTLKMDYLGGWSRPDGKGALLAANRQAVIEIYGAAEGETYEGPAPIALNLALRLENRAAVDDFYVSLLAEEAALEGPPKDQPWGHRSFIINDPDGIPIHYYCDLAIAA